MGQKNIFENIFAEENVDYAPLVINDEREISAFQARQSSIDFKLTATFAKKLAMASQTTKGEVARDYFIRVEQNAKDFANGKLHCMTPQGGSFTARETAEIILSVANQFKDHLPKECLKKLTYTALELQGAKRLR